jgi:hypothetical protein
VEKRIGFLSFGHWQPIPGSQVRTGREALVQSVELAVAAEEIGSRRCLRARAPPSRPPRRAARTSKVEVGTGVIDMRYENPLYMAEEAAATDLLTGGRLQLGIAVGHRRRRCAGRRPSATSHPKGAPTRSWPGTA